MLRKNKILLIILLSIGLSACGGTARFIQKPELKISSANPNISKDLSAVAKSFFEAQKPYEISLCEADEETRSCLGDSRYPSAKGVGGLFLPLKLDLKKIKFLETGELQNGILPFTATLNAPVNNVQAKCGNVAGKISTSNNSMAISIPATYCNWLAIGNVSQSIKLSLSFIDPEEKVFAGYYKISFYGTGNASGSGFYKATVNVRP